MKDDYIWMPKRDANLESGFCHCLTQEAYIELFRQFQKRKTRKYFGKKTAEQKLDSEIHYLLESWLLTDQSDDGYATRIKKSGQGKSKADLTATVLPFLPFLPPLF